MYVIRLMQKSKILMISATKKYEQIGGDPVYYHSIICTLRIDFCEESYFRCFSRIRFTIFRQKDIFY